MSESWFVCAQCRGVFAHQGPFFEAEAELRANFPGVALEECDMVCTDCFEDFKAWMDERGTPLP